jgi:hypothetical protein
VKSFICAAHAFEAQKRFQADIRRAWPNWMRICDDFSLPDLQSVGSFSSLTEEDQWSMLLHKADAY